MCTVALFWGVEVGAPLANGLLGAKPSRSQENMWWDTPQRCPAAESAATKAQTALPQNPQNPQWYLAPCMCFSGPPGASTRLANYGMLPLCMHPIARLTVVGLTRPSISKPYLRARRPWSGPHCRGRFAGQARRLAGQARLAKSLMGRCGQEACGLRM